MWTLLFSFKTQILVPGYTFLLEKWPSEFFIHHNMTSVAGSTASWPFAPTAWRSSTLTDCRTTRTPVLALFTAHKRTVVGASLIGPSWSPTTARWRSCCSLSPWLRTCWWPSRRWEATLPLSSQWAACRWLASCSTSATLPGQYLSLPATRRRGWPSLTTRSRRAESCSASWASSGRLSTCSSSRTGWRSSRSPSLAWGTSPSSGGRHLPPHRRGPRSLGCSKPNQVEISSLFQLA